VALSSVDPSQPGSTALRFLAAALVLGVAAACPTAQNTCSRRAARKQVGAAPTRTAARGASGGHASHRPPANSTRGMWRLAPLSALFFIGQAAAADNGGPSGPTEGDSWHSSDDDWRDSPSSPAYSPNSPVHTLSPLALAADLLAVTAELRQLTREHEVLEEQVRQREATRQSSLEFQRAADQLRDETMRRQRFDDAQSVVEAQRRVVAAQHTSKQQLDAGKLLETAARDGALSQAAEDHLRVANWHIT
jgi:hypothetical protein